MYVCMYICEEADIFIYVCTYVVCMHVYVCEEVDIFMYVCTCVCMHVCI